MALLVDRMVDEREAVIKPLGPILEKQRRYSGALQLGDGRLALLLNPMMLAQLGRGTALVAQAPEQSQQRRARLLVVDDSFATRELIRSILSAAGYEVATAVDGLDALDRLRTETYDLVVSDVEMPRVDGFVLTNRIRNELGKTDLPVIIVTSLASEAHRQRGLEVGAQAYIVKSQFNQNNLLETIRQLIGM
jgi:FOG: CheY-like receiver